MKKNLTNIELSEGIRRLMTKRHGLNIVILSEVRAKNLSLGFLKREILSAAADLGSLRKTDTLAGLR